jgi:hypothetical protein
MSKSPNPAANLEKHMKSAGHDHNGDWQPYIIDVETKKTILVFDSPGNDVFPD